MPHRHKHQPGVQARAKLPTMLAMRTTLVSPKIPFAASCPATFVGRGVHAAAPETRGAIEPEHEVHVLDADLRAALADAVEHAEHDDAKARRVREDK